MNEKTVPATNYLVQAQAAAEFFKMLHERLIEQGFQRLGDGPLADCYIDVPDRGSDGGYLVPQQFVRRLMNFLRANKARAIGERLARAGLQRRESLTSYYARRHALGIRRPTRAALRSGF